MGTTATIKLTVIPKDGPPITPGYTFKVTFTCTVTSLTFSTEIADLNYNIGSGSIKTSAFVVLQSPSCGYTVKPSVSFAPATTFNFITINGSSFDINSSSTADVGKKTIIVTVTLTGQTGIGNAFEFVVNMIDPCETTSLSFSPAVTDMESYVDQAPTIQKVFAVDTKGKIYNNTGLCGKRTFSISPENLPFFRFKPDQN